MKKEVLEFLLTKHKYLKLKENFKVKEELFYKLLKIELNKKGLDLSNFKNFNDKEIEILVNIEMLLEKRLGLKSLKDEIRKLEYKLIMLMFSLLEKETELPAEIKDLKEKFKNDVSIRLITKEKLLKTALEYMPE